MRRRVLSTRCLTDDVDAKGAHVANALRVDAGIGVSKIYTKRAQRDATGHAKAFREAFTKIDCLINYLSTIPHPADEVSITEVMGPNEEDARYHVNLEKCTRGCTYWQSIGIACKHAVAVWEMYQIQLGGNHEANGEEQEAYDVRRAKWAVNHKPWFLAADFIAAANVLKGNQIKLPCDSIMQSNPTKYPSVPIADKKLGRRRTRRGDPRTRCGICQQRGHNRKTCDYYESWFDWDNPAHDAFRKVFRQSLSRR